MFKTAGVVEISVTGGDDAGIDGRGPSPYHLNLTRLQCSE
jgi:hypothetical protein